MQCKCDFESRPLQANVGLFTDKKAFKDEDIEITR